MSSSQKGLFRTILLSLALIMWLAEAQADSNSRTVFDIPSQSLATALERFGRQTGALGVYDGRVVGNRVSSSVRGDLSLKDALSVLLEGTGLSPEFTSKDTFVVFLQDETGAIARRPIDIGQYALSSQDLAERSYSALLQQAVESAFCTNALTRSRDYRAAISIRIDRSGLARQVRLLSPTGDTSRDDAIVTVANQVALSEAPPSRMSQPFVMVVLPHSSGAVLDCAQPGKRG